MALDPKTCQEIIRRTLKMWEEKAANDEVFLGLTRGKERGQRMADFVDERTTELLDAHFATRFQSGKGGAARARSMDGNRRLIQNRERTIAEFEKRIAEYKAQMKHTLNQTGLGFCDEPD